MEPWLDSLSEDWNSEPRLSSPTSSITGKNKFGTSTSSLSQSRIPHLAHSLRKDSKSGSFLKPRSSRGIAKAKGVPVLSERSPSSLNLLPSSPNAASLKQRTSTLPRRVSSIFSDSQTSVQHHTVASIAELHETPEWKKRLVKGEDVVSDGFDLFSPSKLEGIFAQPVKKSDTKADSPAPLVDKKPWSALKAAPLSATQELHHTFRTSRSRAPVMEALHEVNEDEDEDEEHGRDDMSAISSDLVREGALQGLVQRRVEGLEQGMPSSNHDIAHGRSHSHTSRDPRWRTSSGQQEIRNEIISPVTASAQNSIREKALRESVDLDPAALRKKLLETKSDDLQRPLSRSSDYDISYDGHGFQGESMLHEEHLSDITSQSLPEDLSMGTQEFVTRGGFINTRRGCPSNEISFLKKRLSSSVDNSKIDPTLGSANNRFRSSPPPYNNTQDLEVDQSELTADEIGAPQDSSIVRYSPGPQRPPSSGSPLKLFGIRDTYTNNKLMRVLSQYAQDDIEENNVHDDDNKSYNIAQPDVGLRMSQFGQGELDSFHFEKEVERPPIEDNSMFAEGEKIFQGLANPHLASKNSKRLSEQQPSYLETGTFVKRLPSSPAKDRTPKRRRTLLKDEIFVDGVGVEIEVHQVPDKVISAGKKRKDARPGEDGSQADPETLASRSILRPKVSSRKSSASSLQRSLTSKTKSGQEGPLTELTEALAAELASFAQGVPTANTESRKASLATKDYMEEANKVMEIIRNRGKPKFQLPEIQEPEEPSELNPDAILDLEIDDDSTKDSFSRPPSREHPVRPRDDRRHAKHDTHVANHLRKFQESEDLELLASTSMSTLR